ncbi:enoyl-hydratase isomerase family protein [Stylonychia lemnae]|uniref:Enoyl-hydratase isomerase family protein n=1 Tax=Stylonychia lemnae TaxID=5949 RepID=A0A077ZPT5_STYLE|nr:enoyl-hydratase isomerase family protein [Stylonychia lemnae]|eukprot:CDW71385.1 enoyl-hydratase isomerase family protein [Stylonychia lemnae]
MESLPPSLKQSNNVIYGVADPERGVYHIKLNRPEKNNALTKEMSEQIVACLHEAATDESVKALLMYGTNGQFCAGNDVEMILKSDPVPFEKISEQMFAIVNFPKPFFIYVEGCVVGNLACLIAFGDFVYYSEEAFSMTPFMSANLSIEGLSSIMYPKLVGRRKASELLLLDQRLYAKDALKYGFINGIITNNQRPKTEPYIKDIDKIPNLQKVLQTNLKTFMNAKRLMLEGLDPQFLKTHNLREQKTFFDAVSHPDFKKKMQIYIKNLQKKQPQPKL